MHIFDPLQPYRILSLMPTFQCTAECTHCGTLSSPREKTWLPVEDMLAAIDQAANSGYRLVVFTGGEATLAGKNLLVGIGKAASYGLSVRLVTNAYWAVNEKAAKQRITDFVSAGLTEINFSTGDQHARFVPLENVIRATRAAVEAKLPVAIMIEVVKERKITREVVEDHPEFKRLLQDVPSAGISLMESPWMPLSSSVVHEYPGEIAINQSNLATCKGCDSVLSTTTIEADGNIRACCGIGMRQIPELLIGNIREKKMADADRTAANDMLKRWIRVEGPERILAWTASHNPEIRWENMYAHRCQACHRLYKDPKVRQVIGEHHKEKIADILLAEWLLFHYRADADEEAGTAS